MSKEAEFLSQFTAVESMDVLNAAANRSYGEDGEKTSRSRRRHAKVKRDKLEREKVATSKLASITVRLPITHKAYVQRFAGAMGVDTMTEVIIDLIEREARARGWLDAKD